MSPEDLTSKFHTEKVIEECSSKEESLQKVRDPRDYQVFEEVKPASEVESRESRAGGVLWGHTGKPDKAQ